MLGLGTWPKDVDPLKLSAAAPSCSGLIFVILGGLIAFLLYKQIRRRPLRQSRPQCGDWRRLLIGIMLAFRQVTRLYPEVSLVNNFRIADPGLAVQHTPMLLAPMAAILGGRARGA